MHVPRERDRPAETERAKTEEVAEESWKRPDLCPVGGFRRSGLGHNRRVSEGTRTCQAQGSPT